MTPLEDRLAAALEDVNGIVDESDLLAAMAAHGLRLTLADAPMESVALPGENPTPDDLALREAIDAHLSNDPTYDDEYAKAEWAAYRRDIAHLGDTPRPSGLPLARRETPKRPLADAPDDGLPNDMDYARGFLDGFDAPANVAMRALMNDMPQHLQDALATVRPGLISDPVPADGPGGKRLVYDDRSWEEMAKGLGVGSALADAPDDGLRAADRLIDALAERQAYLGWMTVTEMKAVIGEWRAALAAETPR